MSTLGFRETDSRIDRFLQASRLAFWELNLDTNEARFSDSWFDMLGYRREEWGAVTRKSWENLCHRADLKETRRLIELHRDGHKTHVENTVRTRHRDGRWRWLLIRGRLVQPAGGSDDHWLIGAQVDVSREYRTRAHLSRLARTIPGVIYSFEINPRGEGRFPYISDRVEEFYGISVERAMRDSRYVFNSIVPEDQARIDASVLVSMQNLSVWQEDYRVMLDGKVRWMRAEAVPERKDNGSVLWYGMVMDITAQKEMEEQLERLSVTDDLTGLYNRRYAVEKLGELIHHASRYNTPFSLISLDLDHFKQVNDVHGHLVGDDVLRRFGRFLAATIRDSDVAARMGGEEFLLVLPNTTAQGAEALAQDIRQRFGKESFTGDDGATFTLTLSAGVAQVSRNTNSVDQLLKQTDQALYRSKHRGRDRVCVFDEG